ncbi:hypothetical protein FRB94_014023 [Tulasnella sp. JGI-2019a]|nr:hypothetical protein FRB94_014023 [Tulasnella sp. JGI-2019a]
MDWRHGRFGRVSISTKVHEREAEPARPVVGETGEASEYQDIPERSLVCGARARTVTVDADVDAKTIPDELDRSDDDFSPVKAKFETSIVTDVRSW